MSPPPVHVVVHCDGGARGNPGPAGIGATIATRSGRVLEEISESIGWATNNVAEYTALIRALERAQEMGARSVLVRSDSLLLVEQMRGVYRVKNEALRRLHARAQSAARAFEGVEYEHVRRERNKHADALANAAMDAAEATGAPAPPSAPQSSLFD